MNEEPEVSLSNALRRLIHKRFTEKVAEKCSEPSEILQNEKHENAVVDNELKKTISKENDNQEELDLPGNTNVMIMHNPHKISLTTKNKYYTYISLLFLHVRFPNSYKKGRNF